MNLKKILIIGGVVSVFAWSWINSFLSKISYNIINVKRNKLDKQGAVIDLGFAIQNGNDTAFKIVAVDGQIFYKNYELAKFYVNRVVEIQANNTAVMPLSVAVTWAQLLTNAGMILDQVTNNSINVTFRGRYHIQLWGFNFTVPYTFTQMI